MVQGMSAAAMQSQVQQLLAGLAETDSTQQGSAQQPAAAQQSVNGPALQLLPPPQPMVAPFLPAGESHAAATTHARPAAALQLPQPIAAAVAPAEESHLRGTAAQGVARSPATGLQLPQPTEKPLAPLQGPHARDIVAGSMHVKPATGLQVPQPVTVLLAPAREFYARGIAAQGDGSNPARALQPPAPLDAIEAPARRSHAPGTAAGVRTRSAVTSMAAAPAERNKASHASCKQGVQNMPRVPPPNWHAMQLAAQAATEGVQHGRHAAGQLDMPARHAAVARGDHQRSAESRRSQASMNDAGNGWTSPNLVAREALNPSAKTASVEAGGIISLGNPASAAQGPAAGKARQQIVAGDVGLSVSQPLAGSSQIVSEDGAGPATHPANHRAPAVLDAGEALTAAPNGAAQPQPSAGQTAQISSDPTPTAHSTLSAVDVIEQPIGGCDHPAGRHAPKRPCKSNAERSAKTVKLCRMLREINTSAGSLLASGSSEGSLSTAKTRWQTKARQPVRKLRGRRIPIPEKAATDPAPASGGSEGPRIPIPVKAATAPTSACKARTRPPDSTFT